MKLTPALFLDLDGTIRRSKSGHKFIQGPEDVALFPGVVEQVARWKKAGYLIIGVTNQGSIAFGIKTVVEVKAELESTLKSFSEGTFFKVFFSETHPDGKIPRLAHRSLGRKPYYGMLVMAELEAKKEDIIIDWDRSFMVGDRTEDWLCAESADVQYIHAEKWRNGQDNEGMTMDPGDILYPVRQE